MIRWRKHKGDDGNNTILVPDYLESESNNSVEAKSSSNIATWIGAITQAATLIVVVFGYFYTVRPVFQHQLVQEKLASAELDRLEIEEQVQSLQEERDEIEMNLEEKLALEEQRRLEVQAQRQALQEQIQVAENNLNDIQNKIDTVEAQRVVLEEELQSSRQRAQQAQSQASRLEGIVQEQLRELEAARWEFVITDFAIVRFVTNSDGPSLVRGGPDDFLEYLQWSNENWPDPFARLTSSIIDLRERNSNEPRYPESYIDEISEFIESREDRLVCKEPPYDFLEELYRERLSEMEDLIDRKTDDYIDNLRAEYREREEEVLITDDFRSSVARRYRVSEEIVIDFEFKDKVREYSEKCRSIEQNVIDEFRELKEATL